MRQVFTSPRLENVEAVAELLRAEGIAVKISDSRSYRGNRRGNFSYRKGEVAATQAAVWIVNADDQPRGRQLLRDAGLLDSSREGASSYLSVSALDDPRGNGKPSHSMRIKLVLLGLIGVVIVLMVYSARHYLGQAPAPTPAQVAAPRPAPPPLVPESVDTLQVYRADVPTALAKKLVEDALAARKPAQACIAIDGGDPSPALLETLQAPGTALFAHSACPGGDALAISILDYMTDGSGVGEVTRQTGSEAARTLAAERDGTLWRVRDPR